MIEFLKSWVLNIVTLALLIALLEIFLPSGRTKKFVNLVSGFILLIAIVNPFIGFFKNSADLKDLRITSSNNLDVKQIEENSKVLKEKQMKQITDVYRKKVIGEIEDCTREVSGVGDASADVMINEDYNSKTFGEIKRIYIYISMKNAGSAVKTVDRIKKVEIKSGNEPEKNKSVDEEVDPAVKRKIIEKVGRVFEIGEDLIVVSLKKN